MDWLEGLRLLVAIGVWLVPAAMLVVVGVYILAMPWAVLAGFILKRTETRSTHAGDDTAVRHAH